MRPPDLTVPRALDRPVILDVAHTRREASALATAHAGKFGYPCDVVKAWVGPYHWAVIPAAEYGVDVERDLAEREETRADL